MTGKKNFHIATYFHSVYYSLLATALHKNSWMISNVFLLKLYAKKQLMFGICMSDIRFLNYSAKISDFTLISYQNCFSEQNVHIL